MTYLTPTIGLGAGIALLLIAPTPGLANNLETDPLTETESRVSQATMDVLEPSLAHPATAAVVLPMGSSTAAPPLSPASTENLVSDAGTPDAGTPEDWVLESIEVLDQASSGNEASHPTPEDNGTAAATVASPADAPVADPLFSAADLQWVEGSLPAVPPTLASPGDLHFSQSLDGEEPVPSVWHFSFEPFIALPLNTNIGSTTQDVGIDIDISIGDVASSFNRLNFAFLGKFEAWYEQQGVVLNTAYFAVGGGQVRNFRVPPRLQGVLPGTLTADFSADLLKADLMYAYRFTDPPAGGYGRGFTEFDLPPISFDLMGGARLYWIAQEATLTSGLGASLSQSTSNVIVEPVIRGRLRWNTSDYLAVKFDTDVSGFGLGDAFTFSWSALTAVEWMFSGNTSFSAGYQINHINFDRNGGADNINLTSHGPYLSFLFRF